MHFVKAVILFAGIAAAAPTSSSAPASSVAASSAKPTSSSSVAVAASSAKPTSSSVAAAASSSKPVSVAGASSAVASSKAPSSTLAVVASSSSKPTSASAAASGIPTALVATILNDFKNWDSAVDNSVSALQAFTGGSNIQSQAAAINNAGKTLESATSQLISDASTAKSYGMLSTSDSATYTNLIVNDLVGDLVNLFNLVQSKKALFTQVGANLHDGLISFASGIQQIGDILGPHFQSSDLAKIQAAGQNITTAAKSAIAAYS